jgi:hypothetical protein
MYAGAGAIPRPSPREFDPLHDANADATPRAVARMPQPAVSALRMLARLVIDERAAEVFGRGAGPSDADALLHDRAFELGERLQYLEERPAGMVVSTPCWWTPCWCR